MKSKAFRRGVIFCCFIGFSLIGYGDDAVDPLELAAKATNEQISSLRSELKEKYDHVIFLQKQKAEESSFEVLLQEITTIRKNLKGLEEKWRKDYLRDSSGADEGYAFWDQGETTLSQLIMEYGATDYLYIIPYELGAMKVNMFSSIPVPHESWEQMIELILAQNGIGVKKISPLLRQLYIIKHDPSCIHAIVQTPEELMLLESTDLVFYIFAPPPEQMKGIQGFYERFSDPKQTTIQSIGSHIVVIATKENIQKLLDLHAAIWGKEKGKILHVLSLTKIAPIDAEKILKGFFLENGVKTRPSLYNMSSEELVILPIPNGASLVLMGEKRVVERAIKVVEDLEAQLDEPGEMTVFWYTARHSDPQDLANVLEKIYSSLGYANLEGREELSTAAPVENMPVPMVPSSLKQHNVPTPTQSVSPMLMEGTRKKREDFSSKNNVIVDPKSGSIMMVVKKQDIPRIKALLKRLDIPKQMVQIDVLLVEKKLNDRKQTGINLLQIGSRASDRKSMGIDYDGSSNAINKGILDFILSRPARGVLPSFDAVLSFLMAQEDIRINANPSILTVNQTAAQISIMEEVSINNGAIHGATEKNVEKSFSRAEYGIHLEMTPTIHLPEVEDGDGKTYVTLHTDINFETPQYSRDDRPLVTKRKVQNEVRVADGETIIIGGLKKKTQQDTREKIPFLGDIPGIGKLFGTTRFTDETTEMFIFITPHVVKDPLKDLQALRKVDLLCRPGDTPEFMSILEEAKAKEKKKLLEDSWKLFFDRPQ